MKHQMELIKTDFAALYAEVRKYTELLCEPLEIEDYIPQPVEDVSPPKWNIAHTTWFFEEMILKSFSPNYKEFDPSFGFLFNSYYNTIGERTERHKRGDLSRPTVGKVFEYRNHVDDNMAEFLKGDLTPAQKELVILGLNHEQQHQELFLTDLKYAFSVNPLAPVYKDNFALVENSVQPINNFIEIDGGTHEIGFLGDGFCFDNELGRHKVHLENFEIGSSLVTNQEYLQFMSEDPYKTHSLWHSEGWDWVQANKIDAPLYWNKTDGEWNQFTLSGIRKVREQDAVCHISFYEAAAFAEWKGMRLPTEFEWEVASEKISWGERWEWTSSAYLPYPKFKTATGAVGEYNGKFMVNQKVLRGASVATSPNHSRKTYRNFFHPNLRWQFTGIRLVKP